MPLGAGGGMGKALRGKGVRAWTRNAGSGFWRVGSRNIIIVYCFSYEPGVSSSCKNLYFGSRLVVSREKLRDTTQKCNKSFRKRINTYIKVQIIKAESKHFHNHNL